jgi:glutathione S-transferase
MMHLYDFLPSGNGYKVRLLLHKLRIPFELTELDISKGETRTPEFLEKNRNGRIPTLELEDGTCLAESNAILCYLAEGTEFWPADRLARARTLQWLFFEQYSHEPYIAVVRAWKHVLGGMTELQQAQLPGKIKGGYQALDVMEQALDGRRFLVDDRFGLADIALYAYTHVADEGGFDLAKCPAIRAWLDRVAALPRHVPITWRPGNVAAQKVAS